MRTMVPSYPLDSCRLQQRFPGHFLLLRVCLGGLGLEILSFHEAASWKSMNTLMGAAYRSASVINPSLSAELTASPRLLTPSFLKMFRR